MAEKRLMREYERIQEQEKQIEQETTWLTKQLASTQAFLERVAPATKMREKFLAPEKGSRAIVRDLLQKQLLIQKVKLTSMITKAVTPPLCLMEGRLIRLFTPQASRAITGRL